MIIVQMPEPLRGVTHLKMLYEETRWMNQEGTVPSEITVAFQPGHMVEVTEDGAPVQVFEKDADLPETITRKIQDIPAFLAWLASRNAENSGTYGVLFNQRDAMQWIGVQEYTSRGLAVPAALA